MLVYYSRLEVFKTKECDHKPSSIIFKSVAQMVVILAIKEMSYLVVGLFDDLSAPFL